MRADDAVIAKSQVCYLYFPSHISSTCALWDLTGNITRIFLTRINNLHDDLLFIILFYFIFSRKNKTK